MDKGMSGRRVCSAHFVDGRKLETNNVPCIFPRLDKGLGSIVWPVDISTLLNEYERPPVWPDTAAREIDVNQEIPLSSATTSADGIPRNNASYPHLIQTSCLEKPLDYYLFANNYRNPHSFTKIPEHLVNECAASDLYWLPILKLGKFLGSILHQIPLFHKVQ